MKMELLPTLLALAGTSSSLWFLSQYNFWRPVRSFNYPRFLMYHHVGAAKDREDNPSLRVSEEQFARHLQYLSERNYISKSVSELVKEKENLPPRTVAITFDDGYADNYENAVPLLKKHGFKATIYLAPDMKEQGMLSPKQIQDMAAEGVIEFGAHTMNHRNLSTLDIEEAKAEIFDSKQRVEELTGKACETFSYPYGRFTESVKQQVAEAGYSSAVTVKKRIRSISDVFEIPRVGVLGKMNALQFHLAVTRGKYRL